MPRSLPKTCLVLACALLLPSGAALGGEVLQRIQASGVIRIATDPAWPPYSWLAEDGTWQGFDAAVAAEIGRRLGATPQFVTPAWDVVTAGNWGGAWDLSVGSMSPTEDRAQVLRFPATYYFAPTVLATHRDNTAIRSPSDASGRRIGVLRGSIFETYLRHEPMGMSDEAPVQYKITDAVILPFATASEVSDALALGPDAGPLDAMVDDMMYVLFLIKDGAPLRIVGQPVYYGPAALAVEPGDAEFEAELARIIAAMQADGTLSALSETWFGLDLTARF